jgi:starch synthase (maltosyl-transferring)
MTTARTSDERAAPRPRARSQAGAPTTLPVDGRARVVVEDVVPTVDGGRFAAKREIGDRVRVEADVFCDGHDLPTGRVLVWAPGATEPEEARLRFLVNDRWTADFAVDAVGRWGFCIEAWVDHLGTWRRDTLTKLRAGIDVNVELEIGARLLDAAAGDAAPVDGGSGTAARTLSGWAERVRATVGRPERAVAVLDDPAFADVVAHQAAGAHAVRTPTFPIVVDRRRARFSAWYELFPRSASPDPDRPGRLADVQDRLPDIAAMGFDVVYLPPIHPIGRVNRKGRNNSVAAAADDPGSPWAIGSAEGGHDAVHPELGTIDDVRSLAAAARGLGLEIALDLAWNSAPDHPWVEEHPSWFRTRPDGTVQYAENPPKKYQDIYPFDFESDDWPDLWLALEAVVRQWMDVGIRIFRIDNPHTKPFAFWEWLIDRIKAVDPDVLFLSEAFTRPKVMHRLAKLGFSQSYTYFAWRNTAWELREYFTELTTRPGVDYLRPNVWPNTPDILTEYLQHGHRPAFVTRLVLATTLAASYGVYGPTFELCVNVPREPGSEEYLDSEKYQVRHWDLDQPHSLRPLMTRLNAIRASHRALQHDSGLRFLATDNEQLLAYAKTSPDGGDTVLCVVNLDPWHAQSGWITLDADSLLAFGFADPAIGDDDVALRDLLGGGSYRWGTRNYVALDPWGTAAHVFHLERGVSQ